MNLNDTTCLVDVAFVPHFFLSSLIIKNKTFSLCPAERNLGAFQLANSPSRQWRAIRVDLVGSTNSQYPYAQVGWTGNKQYNRSLRKYAKECLTYSLSSTGLYDKRQVGQHAHTLDNHVII